MLALAHQLLGRFGIVPQPGILGELVQFLQPGLRGIPVKDAS